VATMDTETGKGQTTATVNQTTGGKRFLVLRIILLVTLLFGLNAWSIRHLGTDLRDIAIVNTFLAFVGIVLGWIEESEAGRIRAGFSRILKRLVDGQIIAVLYLVSLLGTSFVSSVSVIADGRSGDSTLFLAPEGSKRCADCSGEVLKGPSGVVRFVRLTSIFGHPYYLEASGYQRKGFTLYPWSGKTISLSADLVQLPTIVLRIPHSLHNSLQGGKIVVDFGSPTGSFEIPMKPGRASAQLGPSAIISEGLRNEWRSELRTQIGASEQLREKIYRKWLNPLRSEGMPSPKPAQRIQVRFFTPANKEVINQEIVVGGESLQDVILTPR